MCDPVSITLGSVALAGAGVSAYSQYESGKNQKKQADRNAATATTAATDAIARGEDAAAQVRLQGREVVAGQRTGLGASGVDVASKSAVDVMTGTAGLAELDAQRVKVNAAREAFGYKTQAQNFRDQGEQSAEAGKWGAAGTLLGGAGSALSYGGNAYRVGQNRNPGGG